MYKELYVAAVVVTYNRKELLKKNITMLLKQERKPDKIIIVDNHSSDGTQKEIEREFSSTYDIFDYQYLSHNSGGGGGFEYGVRHACQTKCDLIWLMDDDGQPLDENTLVMLLKKMYENDLEHKPFVLNSLVLHDNETLCFCLGETSDRKKVEQSATDGFIRNLINPFNGTLISRELIDLIGYPNGALVLYGDEADYSRRAIEAGVFVATVIDSLYHHPKNEKRMSIFGKDLSVTGTATWKYYYLCRNRVYQLKKEQKWFDCIEFIIKKSLLAVLAEKRKIESLKYIWRGFMDGMRGKLGANVGPMAEKQLISKGYGS